MQLQRAGWNDFWAEGFTEWAGKSLRPARVLAQYRGSYALWTESGEARGEVAGSLLYCAAPTELPVTGDWVAVRQYSPADLAIITDVLPRRTKFSRKAAGQAVEEQVIAANIDLLLIVCGLDHDYNLRRLERYLVAASHSSAMAVVVLNKADLCPDIEMRISEAQAIALGVPVLAISALSDANAILKSIGTGQTAALVGSSGAGKSTIVNQLLGRTIQDTKPTRGSDSRGRHTTTHRELFFLPNGGLILDNPGIRELQLWAEAPTQAYASSPALVDQAFPEIEALALECTFRDCRHAAEPGCAVQRALSSGALDDARWRSYLKLRREIRYTALQVDENLRRQEKQRFKKACKAVKRNQKRR
jgi:ribosome biogenesis GTPase